MKKGKILIVALIGLLMVGGLVLAGCSDDPEPKSTCSIDKGECSYTTNNYGDLRDIAVCGKSSCRVVKDAIEWEQKPGACNCK
jgi:hypothetical protein